MKAGYGCKIKPCTEKHEENELKLKGVGWKVLLVIWAFVFVLIYNKVPMF